MRQHDGAFHGRQRQPLLLARGPREPRRQRVRGRSHLWSRQPLCVGQHSRDGRALVERHDHLQHGHFGPTVRLGQHLLEPGVLAVRDHWPPGRSAPHLCNEQGSQQPAAVQQQVHDGRAQRRQRHVDALAVKRSQQATRDRGPPGGRHHPVGVEPAAPAVVMKSMKNEETKVCVLDSSKGSWAHLCLGPPRRKMFPRRSEKRPTRTGSTTTSTLPRSERSFTTRRAHSWETRPTSPRGKTAPFPCGTFRPTRLLFRKQVLSRSSTRPR